MSPYFSIIIPTLNEEKFVGNLLEDLTKQVFTSFEVIHIDGHSQDKTRTVVSSFASTFSLTSLVSDRRNLSLQRNIGGKNSKGTYLVFIDADIRINDIYFLQRIHENCTNTACDIYLLTTEFSNRALHFRCAEFVNNWIVRLHHATPRPLPTSGLAVIRKSFFSQIGGYAVNELQDKHTLFLEDQEIMQRAKQYNAKIKYIDNTTYVFSLRRFERDGPLAVLSKILFATIQIAIGRKARPQYYEMGGKYH